MLARLVLASDDTVDVSRVRGNRRRVRLAADCEHVRRG
jgi:hypothetical protein